MTASETPSDESDDGIAFAINQGIDSLALVTSLVQTLLNKGVLVRADLSDIEARAGGILLTLADEIEEAGSTTSN